MGIYDRDYYRKEGPGFLASFSDRGTTCKWLIAANVAIFIAQILTGEMRMGDLGPLTDAMLLNSDSVRQGEAWRLGTYAFLHDPHMIVPIIFNMLFLWWFGSDVEDIYGAKEFLAFYLVSALLGGTAFFIAGVVGLTDARTYLGASGAVTAVMVLCALHYPDRPVYLLFLPVAIPIWLFVGFQVVQDCFVFAGGIRGSAAIAVHLGAALFSFLYHHFQWRILNMFRILPEQTRNRSRRQPLYWEEDDVPVEVAGVAEPAVDADEHLEAKMDAVLEKVARSGKESLTESEQQVLLKASEMYKRKRT